LTLYGATGAKQKRDRGRLVAANKKDAAAWMNLGFLLRASGDNSAGDEVVARAVVLDPTLKYPAAAGASQ
jgi:hypothetical protein